ncbi:MAG: hypothetical protein KGZ75_05075 [Syntrophomonadaceae bacterium]|nr:hypothetical protein [Syntrophomonadaceae bacterium]
MHRLKRVEALLNSGTHETSPVPIASISFFLNLSWLGYNILLALQGYHQTTGMSIWWSLTFLATIIINSSLLIKSLDAFVFAVTVIIIMLWPISFLFLQAWIWMNGFLSAIISPIIALVISLSLIYFCLWFQASKSRIWARRVLLTVQGALLALSLLLMFNRGDLAATPGGMALAVAVVTLLVVPVLIAVAFSFTRKQDGQLIGKIYWAAFIIQIITAIAAVYYYAVIPTV